MSLPGRVVACEDRTSAVETHVVQRLDEMRSELAELRLMVAAQMEAEGDATELVGRLLQSMRSRLDVLETGALAHPSVPAPQLAEHHERERA